MNVGGLVAAVVAAAALAGCGAHAAAAPEPTPKTKAVVAVSQKWMGATDLTGLDALDAVAGTPSVAAKRPAVDWSCNQPMTITVAAGPGVDEARVRQQLQYPVAYLGALGYDVRLTGSTAYVPGMQEPATIGSVVVAVTNRAADDSELVGARAISWRGQTGSHYTSATITVDGRDGLAGDIVLHEFGHVLGLDHKDGTVMAARGEAPVIFDAAETAAIDCR
jgi:hypothetical protein